MHRSSPHPPLQVPLAPELASAAVAWERLELGLSHRHSHLRSFLTTSRPPPLQDTPRSATQFGSLVLLLPAYHSGGTLSIDHAGETKRLDWASESGWSPFSSHWQSTGAGAADKLKAHVPPAVLRCDAGCFRPGPVGGFALAPARTIGVPKPLSDTLPSSATQRTASPR